MQVALQHKSQSLRLSDNSEQVLLAGSQSVFINIYEFFQSNHCFSAVGMGVFHSGVEVYQKEYAFGGHDFAISGIFNSLPLQPPLQVVHKKKVFVGVTKLSEEQVQQLVENMATYYLGNRYHILERNCNHFSKDLVRNLTGQRSSFPKWVNRSAKLANYMRCIIPQSYLPPPSEYDITKPEFIKEINNGYSLRYFENLKQQQCQTLIHIMEQDHVTKSDMKQFVIPQPCMYAEKTFTDFLESIEQEAFMRRGHRFLGNVLSCQHKSKLNDFEVKVGQLQVLGPVHQMINSQSRLLQKNPSRNTQYSNNKLTTGVSANNSTNTNQTNTNTYTPNYSHPPDTQNYLGFGQEMVAIQPLGKAQEDYQASLSGTRSNLQIETGFFFPSEVINDGDNNDLEGTEDLQSFTSFLRQQRQNSNMGNIENLQHFNQYLKQYQESPRDLENSTQDLELLTHYLKLQGQSTQHENTEDLQSFTQYLQELGDNSIVKSSSDQQSTQKLIQQHEMSSKKQEEEQTQITSEQQIYTEKQIQGSHSQDTLDGGNHNQSQENRNRYQSFRKSGLLSKLSRSPSQIKQKNSPTRKNSKVALSETDDASDVNTTNRTHIPYSNTSRQSQRSDNKQKASSNRYDILSDFEDPQRGISISKGHNSAQNSQSTLMERNEGPKNTYNNNKNNKNNDNNYTDSKHYTTTTNNNNNNSYNIKNKSKNKNDNIDNNDLIGLTSTLTSNYETAEISKNNPAVVQKLIHEQGGQAYTRGPTQESVSKSTLFDNSQSVDVNKDDPNSHSHTALIRKLRDAQYLHSKDEMKNTLYQQAKQILQQNEWFQVANNQAWESQYTQQSKSQPKSLTYTESMTPRAQGTQSQQRIRSQLRSPYHFHQAVPQSSNMITNQGTGQPSYKLWSNNNVYNNRSIQDYHSGQWRGVGRHSKVLENTPNNRGFILSDKDNNQLATKNPYFQSFNKGNQQKAEQSLDLSSTIHTLQNFEQLLQEIELQNEEAFTEQNPQNMETRQLLTQESIQDDSEDREFEQLFQKQQCLLQIQQQQLLKLQQQQEDYKRMWQQFQFSFDMETFKSSQDHCVK